MQVFRQPTETTEAHGKKYHALERMLGEARKDQPWNALTGGKSDRVVGKAKGTKRGEKL
jgi:hypothetical protein